MAINLSDSAEAFKELREHIGHKIVCVGYGQDSLANVAIECEDCDLVLIDFNHPDYELPDGTSLKQINH